MLEAVKINFSSWNNDDIFNINDQDTCLNGTVVSESVSTYYH